MGFGKMTAAAILTALWPGLRRVLLAIGRWLMGVIRDEGVKFLAGYMRQRVHVFRKRLAKVVARRHAKWRPRWLRGRIRRWNYAIAWLQSKHAAKLKGEVLRAADHKATYLIPEEAPGESFGRWRRQQRAA